MRGSRASGGGSADPAAAGNGGNRAAVGKENAGRGVDLVYPALSRRSTPRGEPLCCKQLAQMPLSQVVVVRAGVVTLCAEGLLKLWARPSMPPPLPPLPVGGTRLARKKVRGGGRGAQTTRPVRRCAGVCSLTRIRCAHVSIYVIVDIVGVPAGVELRVWAPLRCVNRRL